ncbi:uncharacterized protein il2 [Brachyistius frenatus]|uniref:uncharacterized protein il2 n=1 Tax=Brachyistius frenatus TaxID=100188 RepID=UPI0037E92A13
MEHFIKMAFCAVILSACLQARPMEYNVDGIIRLIDEVTCLNNSIFYSPENVKEECITAALDCILRELNGTAKVECDDPAEGIDDVLEILYLKIQKRNTTENVLTNSEECACEIWPETPLNEFRNKFTTLLQLEYSTSLR